MVYIDFVEVFKAIIGDGEENERDGDCGSFGDLVLDGAGVGDKSLLTDLD